MRARRFLLLSLVAIVAFDARSSDGKADKQPGPALTRTVVSPDGWKLCLSDGDKHVLFNLEENPWETTNLFYKEQHRDVIERLTRKIHAWQKAVKDTAVFRPA